MDLFENKNFVIKKFFNNFKKLVINLKNKKFVFKNGYNTAFFIEIINCLLS